MLPFDPNFVYLALLIFLRVSMVLVLCPPLGGAMIPVRVRVVLAFLITHLVVGTSPAAVLPVSYLGVIVAALQELIVGLLMGMAVRLFFGIAEVAGQFISREIGLSMSLTINPVEGTQDSSMSLLLYYLAGLIFFVGGFHHDVLESFVASLHFARPGSALAQGYAVSPLIDLSAQIIYVGLQMAAPFLAVMFLVNLAFAVLGKVAPNVNVFVVSFAVRTGLGLWLLMASAGLLVSLLYQHGQMAGGNMLDWLAP
ncbi:MAG: flagellar biosynthetic protein FliR [Verrucomicrobiota bacterium JB022]|nr:flagellar biosynthetic protein FliR [Verrucomicrobiota bacterium JB022]